ncbi:MAG: dihydropteroate synthase [Clostridioides difficile]|nr:dihydropteroate synthase [Clostridioides sp.]MBS5788312.1 dihydropteroate synthase [Clostridioides difficile]
MFKYGKKTYIMGILNVTPDSFSDGGDFNKLDKAIKHAKEMVDQGADIIDLGGESTRPGHTVITSEEEIDRITPVIKRIKSELDIPVSVDTYKVDVAEAALKLGVDMINDIWGLQKDELMASAIAKYDAEVCIMHNQDGTDYEGDIMRSIKSFLNKSIEIALNSGIKKEKIVLDPGIGFGKTFEQNIEVLKRMSELKELGYPILLGTSRKRVIANVLNTEPKDRVEGTVATTVLGIKDGVDIVRVHDVLENSRAAKMADAIIR